MTGTLTRQQSRDHPRLRGEYHYICQTRTKRWGSPPLARGIQLWRQPSNLESGITPACAGNTLLLRTNETSSWDHPRLRGEYIRAMFPPISVPGSPPLARGILGERLQTFEICKDHPRLRGEYVSMCLYAFTLSGSPPLARGIQYFKITG